MLTLADLEAARAAQQVQQHAPTWFVIWSLRHRRFEAWNCTDPDECHIVCANSATALWDLMQQVELDLWRTSPHGDQPPSPGATDHPHPPLPIVPGAVLALPPGHSERTPGPHPPSPEGSQP
ncbi:hypothetical protein ACIBF6_08975 [Streptosporangium amethystogenes]|uniref:hypothetical protein n=1 Tax=Streptosporangium amethystogenes TaxID=2002 RepID=UPI0037BC962E